MKRKAGANVGNANTNANRTAKRGRANAGLNVNANANLNANANAAPQNANLNANVNANVNANLNANAAPQNMNAAPQNANAAPVPYQMVVYKAPEEIANGAIGGDHAAYLQLVKSEDNELKALIHFNAPDAMARGFQMAARPTDPSVREVIIQQEFISKAANKSYLFVLHLLEDVEAIQYTPPKSEQLIKKFIGHYVPTQHYDYENIRASIISLLNEEQVAGDLCAGALMNALPYILAAYGTIKYFAKSGKFQENLAAIHKDVESTLRAVRIYKHYVDEKSAKNATYNQRLIELQGRVMGGLNKKKGITALPLPPRAPLGGGENAVGSQIEAVVEGAPRGVIDRFIFGAGKSVNITEHLPQIYALINFLGIMFPEIALKCYMVLPDNQHLTDTPSFYPQFTEQSYKEAVDYFTAGAVVPEERKKVIEHVKEEEVEEERGEKAAKCSKVDLENRLSQLGETTDVPFLKKVVTKLFDLGCYVGNSIRAKPVAPPAAAGAIAVEARNEIARIEDEPAPEQLSPGGAAAAAEESEDASAAASALLSMIGSVPNGSNGSNGSNGTTDDLHGGSRAKKSNRKSKSRKTTRRRITRSKKNLRSTRFRISRKFL